jgi:hypothetical protein
VSKLGDLVVNAGANYATMQNTLGQGPGLRCILITLGNVVTLGGPNVVSVDIRPTEGNSQRITFPAPTNVPGDLMVPTFGAMAGSAQVTVNLDANAAATTTIGAVYEFDDVPAGWAYAPPWEPVNVAIASGLANPLPVSVAAPAQVPVLVQNGVGSPVPVNATVQNVDQVSGASVVGFSPVIAAGATSTLIPAVAGKTIRLYGMTWSVSTNAGAGVMLARIETTAGVLIDRIRNDVDSNIGAVASPAHNIDLKGVALPTGVGVRAGCDAGALTTEFDGCIVYTQT